MTTRECADLFKALGEETRLLILQELLKHKEVCACKLLEKVNCNQSTLSHHMKILVDSGLVTSRKEWKWVHYAINKAKLDILLNCLK